MKKKIVAVIFIIIVVLIIAWLLFGVGNEEENGEFEAKESQATDVVWEKIEEACGYAPIVKQGEQIKQDDWSYQVNEAEWTKKQGDWPLPDKNWYQCDKNGNVLGNVTLLKVNITITCEQKNKEWDGELYLNSNFVDLYDEWGEKIFTEYEAVSAKDIAITRKDAFQIFLEKKESITTDLVYVIDDEAKEKAKYALLWINNVGEGKDTIKPNENSYIRLEIGEKSDENSVEK